jgi:hypothetical protein
MGGAVVGVIFGVGTNFLEGLVVTIPEGLPVTRFSTGGAIGDVLQIDFIA